MRVPLMIIYFFAALGLALFGLITHETIHVLQAEPAYSICYDFGQKSTAHVQGNFIRENGRTAETDELISFAAQVVVTFGLLYVLSRDFKYRYGVGK